PLSRRVERRGRSRTVDPYRSRHGFVFCRRRSPTGSIWEHPACAVVERNYADYGGLRRRRAHHTFSLLRTDSWQHVRRILWPAGRRSATMGVLKSVEPTGFLAFAPALAGTTGRM